MTYDYRGTRDRLYGIKRNEKGFPIEFCRVGTATIKERAVFAVMVEFAPNVRPAAPTIADLLNTSEREIRRLLKSLEKKGYIRVQRSPGRPNTYHLDPGGYVTPADMSPLTDAPDTPADTAAPPRRIPPPKQTKKAEKKADKDPKSAPQEAPKDPIVEVFEHWAKVLFSKHHHKRAPKLTDKRRSPIKARLKDGYSVTELKRVISAVARSDWHNGQNDKGKTYIEPETIFRDAGKVDGWLATKTANSPPAGNEYAGDEWFFDDHGKPDAAKIAANVERSHELAKQKILERQKLAQEVYGGVVDAPAPPAPRNLKALLGGIGRSV